MDDFVPFASREYFVMLTLLLVSRGLDFLSTWIATPNLVLEGNPIARRMGWRWGIPVNLAVCVGLAFWPLTAIVLTTTSVLVAARNFQSAWLMRSLGEEHYRDWHLARIQQARMPLYLFCLLGQTLLVAVVGSAVVYFSQGLIVPQAIGVGIVVYAVAVLSYSLLSVWRLRRMRRYLNPDR